MKKYLLFIISMLCVSIGTWAEATLTQSGSTWTITVHSGDAADLSDISPAFNHQAEENCIVKVVTESGASINAAGVSAISNGLCWNYRAIKQIDLSDATLTGDLSSASFNGNDNYSHVNSLIMPKDGSLPAESLLIGGGKLNNGSNPPLYYVIVPSSDGSEITLYIPATDGNNDTYVRCTTDILSGETFLTDDNVTAVNLQFTSNVGSSTKETFENYIFGSEDGQLHKQRAFDGVVTNVTGGSVQTDVEAALNGKPASKVKSLTITSGTLTAADVTYIQALTGLETLDLTGVTNFGEGVTKATINASVPNGATVLYPVTYTVDGCNVTINTANPFGDDLATILAAAKTALGSTNICTLIVTGPVTNNDLIALGGTDMTGATRIDLSGATLASGVTIDNLQIPSSLESLVLPKDQTVSVGLASKLADATSLEYAYSPSSSEQDDDQAIADYIWVNKAGGLKAAASAEAAIRTAVYVKIESKVALNNDDAKFGSMGISATTETDYPWQYIDMSGAGVTAEATLEATAPHDKGYRIILPDNLTGDHMAIFASNSNHENVAALYSYSGTTLRILEITDASYKTDALNDSRIVLPGTTAIEVVSGTYNDTKYGTFGQTSVTTNNLLAAINNAASSIKSVTISDVTTASDEALTFNNSNLTSIQLDGVKSFYDDEWHFKGPIVNVNSCSSLQTLNLINCELKSVTANNTSLTSVNLTGTGVSDDVNLSNSGLRTLTTNSNTWIQGDLHLESTKSFTSFASTAKFGVNNATNGNIYLNASGVSTVDLQSVQFQNESSKIHIDSTVGEGDTPLTNLNAAGQLTIYIPTGFTRTRLHPYSSATLDDNIAELAPSSAFEDTCKPDHCKIVYDADAHVATVYCYTPGHFKALMEKNDNYGKFVDGAIFTFDASCKLNYEDLAALAGKDGYGNFNWNYVDLYDLPASYTIGETTVNYADVITAAINILRTNNWQYKGLLLPKTTNLGTTLIQDPEDATKVATCSQFIAYSGAIGTSALTAAYIYKAADDWGITHAERLGKMKAVMNLHPEIMNTTTNWSVSTNSPTPIDMSILPTSVTIEGNPVNTSKLETVNNDMVAGTGIPSIYAYPAYENVMYTVATSTGIGNTPNLEILKVTGPVNATDIASINKFTDGPRVFDISGATTTITKDMLESITNANIEYIILPAGMTKADVCEANYTTNLKNGKLKAVISSTSTNLVAYVNTPGSLAEARYYATGGSVDANTGLITPTQTGMQNITLAGKLNAADIAANTTTHHVAESGHWVSGGSDARSKALSGEQGTITTIDLKDAVFEEYTPTGGKLTSDMNFSYAGLGSIRNITLPTNMTLIPANCFKGIQSFVDLCIPYNYTKIDNSALHGTYCSHITTTDAAGSLIDNGPRTYTFSANLEEIGSKPSTKDANGVYSLSENVFPHDQGQTDVYVLAHKVPKCYAYAFPANMLYGWGGFKGAGFPYCREKYDNSNDGSKIFTVLHFPDKASYADATEKTGPSYEDMEKLYTDINKVYTKKEQTGAVDANGDPVAWPTFAELRRAYNQASNGITWNDWTLEPDANGEVVGGHPIPTAKNAIAEGPHTDTYSFSDYEGWHQFVLSQATYVKPGEEQVEIAYREYVQDDSWYTFCIPFDMTEEDVIKLMGVPASTNKVKTTTDKFGDHPETETDKYQQKELLPEIRTIKSVTRTPSTNTVNIYTSQDLGTGTYKKTFYKPAYGVTPEEYESNGTVTIDGSTKDVMIRGGYPYLIKPWKLRGTTISSLGKDIMTRYQFRATQSSIYHTTADCYDSFGSGGTKTGTFARPYEGHKIQAVGDPGGALTHQDEAHKDQPYNYTYVGQFWKQSLPLHCFYQNSKRLWRHYQNYDARYFWNPYTCIIMVTDEVQSEEEKAQNKDLKGGKFRDEVKCQYPASSGLDKDGGEKFDKTLEVYYKNGLDDPFDKASARGYQFFFDDDIMDFDSDGQATAIEVLDGVRIAPVRGKVYNMAGQYVGNSLEGLSKGMYIVNGKKYVIK